MRYPLLLPTAIICCIMNATGVEHNHLNISRHENRGKSSKTYTRRSNTPHVATSQNRHLLNPFEATDVATIEFKPPADAVAPAQPGDVLHKAAANSLVIHIYGGSVSVGAGTTTKYSDFLLNRLPPYNVTVQNFAIGASGTETWLSCGLTASSDPDIIISEFRINEADVENLRRWYRLISQHARHIVIFDIWSWLSPPTRETFRCQGRDCTFHALLLETRENDSPVRLNDNFSVLSLSLQDMLTWESLVPEFFHKFSSPARKEIPQACFDHLYEDSSLSPVLQDCFTNYANEMQHGNERYHQHLGLSLTDHLMTNVLPKIKTEQRKVIANTHQHNNTCFGGWGGLSTHKSWDLCIVDQKGYEVGTLFSTDAKKETLHTNNSNATLVLDCPVGFQGDVVKLGYVGHNMKNETVSFAINGQNYNTHIQMRLNAAVRVRRTILYRGGLPINISIVEMSQGNYLELSDFDCLYTHQYPT